MRDQAALHTQLADAVSDMIPAPSNVPLHQPVGTMSTALKILYYCLLPVGLVLRGVLYLLHWLVTPFIYIVLFLGQCLLVPWRIFAYFETLWYILGAAVLFGGMAGVLVHFVLKFVVVTFDLDRQPPPKDIAPKGHDAASYRASREQKKQKKLQQEQDNAMRARLLASQPLIQEVVREARRHPIVLPTSTPKSPNTSTAATRSGLFQQIILEHTDEEDNSVY